jgi:NAD(P)-dependent dehydrogenase (short-subunit alcohol dehydrogenase family)
MNMSNSLTGKTVVIAGGSSGMGLALARRAAAAGAHIHIVGRSTEKLTAAKVVIDGDVHAHVANIGVEADVTRLAADIPRVDHLIVTAADLVFKPFEQITDDEINAMLGPKFWGPVYLVRHFATRLSEDASVTFFSGSAAYKASSGGIRRSAECSPSGSHERSLSNSHRCALTLSPPALSIARCGTFYPLQHAATRWRPSARACRAGAWALSTNWLMRRCSLWEMASRPALFFKSMAAPTPEHSVSENPLFAETEK